VSLASIADSAPSGAGWQGVVSAGFT
jgi:hypothetical protein